MRINNSRTFCFILAVCCHWVLNASPQPSVSDLRQYFNTIRQTTYQPLPASALTDTQNGEALIDVIIPYCNDSTEMVRSKAYYALKRIGQGSTSENVRRRAVHQLVLGMRDAGSGIVSVTIDALTGFGPGDFANIDRDSIGTFIRPNAYHLDEAMKLAGYLQLTARPILNNPQAPISTTSIRTTRSFLETETSP